MGTGYLIDTSAFGNFLRANLSQEGIELMKEILQNSSPQISVITRIELMSWIPPTVPAKVAVKDFVNSAEIFDLTETIIIETIRIRKLPDAVIAATAIVHNLTLLSTNDSDFLKVPKLKYKSLNT
ncbi:type II toxin-antitoxin system VapC family toxin [Runella sp.]|uniref:type II toxin-antitoxin system VapC family toxin n=1 Tax=Runella sp. TaxID=1960881 RepID=UPI003D0F2F31